MLIVGTELKTLVNNCRLVDDSTLCEQDCISLSLGEEILYYSETSHENTLFYGKSVPKECICRKTIDESGLLLKPLQGVLASTNEKIRFPVGYFGLIQTKGSLARLLVSVHMSDGQIDPGYEGKITLEIFNGSNMNVCLFKGQKVANLYIFKTYGEDLEPYRGRYYEAQGPTHYIVKEL